MSDCFFNLRVGHYHLKLSTTSPYFSILPNWYWIVEGVKWYNFIALYQLGWFSFDHDDTF